MQEVPVSVVLASTLQFALAVPFLVIPVLAYLYGDSAQRAGEAEVLRQGFRAEVLEEHRIRFKESGPEMLFPFAIAVCLATLASLNLAGNGTGRILSWVFETILLIGGGFITGSQVFAARYTEAALKKSSDPALHDLDARAVIRVAQDAFPAWLRPLVLARFVLTTLGSLLVILLLMTPAASAYFH